MDSLKFTMMVKLLDRYEYKITEFLEEIEKYAERQGWAFMGITEISGYGVSYRISKTTGARNCYDTEYDYENAKWSDIINYKQNKGEKK